jgi:hypothetical protein
MGFVHDRRQQRHVVLLQLHGPQTPKPAVGFSSLKTTLSIQYTSPTTAYARARRLMRQPTINVESRVDER